jgi:hypothetical protein
LNAERPGARHGHGESFAGKKQKAFAAAGQVVDLWGRLAAIDFKGERKADRCWTGGGLPEAEYRIN